MQSRQEGQDRNSGYSQKDTKTMRSEPHEFSQQLRSSACNSMILLSLMTEQIGPGPCVGLCILLCFESGDRL